MAIRPSPPLGHDNGGLPCPSVCWERLEWMENRPLNELPLEAHGSPDDPRSAPSEPTCPGDPRHDPSQPFRQERPRYHIGLTVKLSRSVGSETSPGHIAQLSRARHQIA
jgi:hypothetical protein